jgi:hypothetical protein
MDTFTAIVITGIFVGFGALMYVFIDTAFKQYHGISLWQVIKKAYGKD